MFAKITSLENLLDTWEEFLRGKRGRTDVQIFSLRLFDGIYSLHSDLVSKTYEHGGYTAFKVSDPKPRHIHKASVRDRLLHHAVYRVLYPFFDTKFIADSFSCRNDKGTHRALRRFGKFTHIVGKNDTKQCWILKCDIRKFFASIDHEVLITILRKHIHDVDTLWLCEKIIRSFEDTSGKGLPLGNLTSQLFANVYLNGLDQFVKHTSKAKYYIRYADDFVVFSGSKEYLEDMRAKIENFIKEKLHLSLHKDKVSIRSIGSGVDFLGWVHFSDHHVLRTATRKRMFRRLRECSDQKTTASYTGLLVHGNAYTLRSILEEKYLTENCTKNDYEHTRG